VHAGPAPQPTHQPQIGSPAPHRGATPYRDHDDARQRHHHPQHPRRPDGRAGRVKEEERHTDQRRQFRHGEQTIASQLHAAPELADQRLIQHQRQRRQAHANGEQRRDERVCGQRLEAWKEGPCPQCEYHPKREPGPGGHQQGRRHQPALLAAMSG
jgi:hypothetical protein